MVRHQLDYNLDVVRTLTRQGAELDVMRIQMDRMLHEMADHRNRVAQVLASMEASLRSEILGTDSREDQLERDVIRLYAMTAMLQQRLDQLSSGFAADESSDSGALTDGERSVTPIRHIASDRPS